MSIHPSIGAWADGSPILPPPDAVHLRLADEPVHNPAPAHAPLVTPAGWGFVALADLPEPGPVDWLWPGVLPLGALVLFSAAPKAGKTTVLSHLVRDLHDGTGLAARRVKGPVLIASEEPDSLWGRRRADLGMQTDVRLLRRPGFGRLAPGDWARFVDYMADGIRREGCELCLIDTLGGHWPVMNENDAAEVDARTRPLRALAEAGACVVLVHHCGKNTLAGVGKGARGSSALVGVPDVAVELRRADDTDPRDRRRVLSALGRFDGLYDEVVLELDGGVYSIVEGNLADAREADERARIAAVLPATGPGMTPEEVLAALGPGAPGINRLRALLIEGASKNRFGRTGTGRRGDSFRFVTRHDTLGPVTSDESSLGTDPF